MESVLEGPNLNYCEKYGVPGYWACKFQLGLNVNLSECSVNNTKLHNPKIIKH